MKFSTYALFALALVMAMCMPVSAQVIQDSGFIVKAGVFFPQGDTQNDYEFTVGIELEQPAAGIPGMISYSADWVGIRTTDPDDPAETTTANLVPIMVNWKQRQMVDTVSSWNYGVGLGAYWAIDDIPDMDLSSGLSFAWQLMAGYNFTPDFSVDVRYLASTSPSDDGLIGLSVGYRF